MKSTLRLNSLGIRLRTLCRKSETPTHRTTSAMKRNAREDRISESQPKYHQIYNQVLYGEDSTHSHKDSCDEADQDHNEILVSGVLDVGAGPDIKFFVGDSLRLGGKAALASRKLDLMQAGRSSVHKFKYGKLYNDGS